jgi:hypothetical protein
MGTVSGVVNNLVYVRRWYKQHGVYALAVA